MALLKITENPTTADTVLFEFSTPDANGCFLANPYRIDTITIFFVERNFSSGNLSEYVHTTYEDTKLALALEAEAAACASPTDENILEAKRARAEADTAASMTSFYFNDAYPVKIYGNSERPAWSTHIEDEGIVFNVIEDEDGNIQYGQFQFEWEPVGMREGDYFICWKWTPLVSGESLSAHERFTLAGSTQISTSLPTHFTVPDKYSKLLERYTPDMYKLKLCDDDRTPDVLDKFNDAIADGFTTLENLANQLVDLQDANSLHEYLIPYLSNLFDLKLKTNDPTRWRRQIKRAIPLFKQKGTKAALKEALDQAGIKLVKLTRLWQVVSPYTWQEAFVYDDTKTFTLEKVALPKDGNFIVYFKPASEDSYIELTPDYLELSTSGSVSTITWVGDSLSIDPFDLVEGDIIRVIYKYAEIPNSTQQTLETYIRTLPLADQRTERDVSYPPKNWNVRLIEEDDSLFNLIVPSRHPFADLVVFGKVRTEFPYSENVYNSEEYNGSLRDSKLPCDIDKDFIDSCGACLSSKFNISLEIEDLSDDRIIETQEVIKEYSPFHAVVHNMSFLGGVDEFVEPPVEEIEILVTYDLEEFVVSGEGQTQFNRSMLLGMTTNAILRNQLAESSEVVSTTSGTAYNDEIVLYCPDVSLDRIGMSVEGDAILEILAPSLLETTTTISEAQGHIAVVGSGSYGEPIDPTGSVFGSDLELNNSAFTFRISNPVLDGTLCNIFQDNIYKIIDEDQDFGALGVKSTWDIEQGTTTAAWKISIPDYSASPYTIKHILPDGSLLVENDGSLPNVNGNNLTYSILDADDVEQLTSVASYRVTKRGRTVCLNTSVQDIFNTTKIGYYQIIDDVQYKIIGYVTGTDDEFYIADYESGDIAGENLKVYQRVADNEIGYLSYRGLKLRVTGDLETDLGIPNGHRNLGDLDNTKDDDKRIENHLVFIDGSAYFMSDIDGDSPSGFTTITLQGHDHYWRTWAGGGTSVDFTILRYTRQSFTVPAQNESETEHTFASYDRRGREIVTGTTPDTLTVQSASGAGFVENVMQDEGISFTIEYKNGAKTQGEI